MSNESKQHAVQEEIVLAVQAYGDARADGGDSAAAIANVIRLLRATQQATTGDERAAVERCAQICESVMEQSRNHLFRSAAKICAMSIRDPAQPCDRAPDGWKCSRVAGHEGPCAASQEAVTLPALCANDCLLPEARAEHPVAGSAGQAAMTGEQRQALQWAADRAHVESLGKSIGGVEGRRWRILLDLIRNSASAPTAPSLTTDAGAVLSDLQRATIQAAADSAHRVLIAGGDGGDELSDAGLRRELKESRDMLRALLAAHPTEQRMSDAARTSAFGRLVAAHAEFLDGNPYCYFELAYTRQTGWMAWITDRPAQGEPGTAEYAKSRKVITRGQGDTAEDACADAMSLIDAARNAEIERQGGEA